jgi:hypothetical protein
VRFNVFSLKFPIVHPKQKQDADFADFLSAESVSSQYFGVTIFEPRQIWEEKPFLRLSWRIWHSRFVATPFF